MNKLRYSAIGAALPVLFYVVFSMTNDLQNSLFAKGRIQIGHADLECLDCHKKTPGTVRQQVQANAHHLLGMRESGIDFGYAKVSSDQCLDCHDRPNERHPIFRFQEPRFAAALKQVEATSCLGCHSEHHDRRVNDNILFCAACHSDLELKADPIDVPHHELIARKQWDTCMGCHDFHGNHVRQTQTKLGERYAEEQLRAYLASGKNPYGDKRHFKAKTQ